MVDKKNRKQYAEEQLELGRACYTIGEIDKAIEHFSAIKPTDNAEVYAKAQFNLGVVYWGQGKLAKAIDQFGVINRLDEAIYAKAQFNIAMLYLELKDLDSAIEHLNVIKRTDDAKFYARAQFFLGAYYSKQNNPVEAIKHFSAIEQIDDAKLYAQAQSSISDIYYQQDNLDEAQKHIDEALAQPENVFFEASLLSAIIAVLQAYTKGDNAKDNHYYAFKKGLEAILMMSNKVQNLLLIRFEEAGAERKVATYTPVHVAKIFIDNKQESFHLNIANCMNDPTEGQSLFQWMGCLDNTETTNTLYGFLTSFTFNHNSLNQFRLYGKIDGKEGTGVSVVVSTEMFSDKFSYNHIDVKLDNGLGQFKLKNQIEKDQTEQGQPEKSEIEQDQRALIAEKLPLYRCIYINPDNGYVSLARRSRYSFFLEHGDLEGKTRLCTRNRKLYNKYKKDMDKLEKIVRESLQKIKTNYEKVSALADKKQLRQQTDQLIRKILLPLSFLTKHAAFEEEAECRIIYVTDIANEKVTFEKERLFVTYGVPVLDRQTGKNYLNKIYLGPKVENVVKIELQHLYYQQGMSEHIKIEKSNLPLA